MPYLIDGHNLIPKAGLRLNSIDDETELITILQEFCRLTRKSVEVYFDGAPPGHAGTRTFGSVAATFVRLGSTADEAIRRRLKALGKSAKNWTVVTSDRQVQAEARAVQAEILTSEAFAGTMKQARASASKGDDQRDLSSAEVEEWLRIFQERKEK